MRPDLGHILKVWPVRSNYLGRGRPIAENEGRRRWKNAHSKITAALAPDNTKGRPQTLKRQGSVSVDAAYRAMPTHHTPTEFDAKGSSGQSAWAGVMPDAAAPPPSPAYRASGWPGWSKK